MTGSPDGTDLLSSIDTHEANNEGQTKALVDDSIKGLLRSLGDAGAAPTDSAGKTLLKLLADIHTLVDAIGIKDTPCGSMSYISNGNVNAGDTVVVIDISGEFVTLEGLDFASNDGANGELIIEGYKKDGSLGPAYTLIQCTGILVATVTPDKVAAYSSSILEAVTCGAYNKVLLKGPVDFPQGVKVSIKNNAGQQIGLGCSAVVSRYTQS